MSEIRKYVLVDTDDQEGDHEYDSYDEALEQAQKNGDAVIARVYEYADSELVWTPDGEQRWPPNSDE